MSFVHFTLVELYLNGIQRDSFLPCIEHIKEHMHVVNLSTGQDFRTSQRTGDVEVEAAPFEEICKDPKPVQMHLNGRVFVIPSGEIGVGCQIDFPRLFSEPLAAGDYIDICKTFPHIFITAVPTIDPTMRSEIRRFITFVDVCYEQKVERVDEEEVF